jgi:Predicted HD superfamily hydrolase
MNNYHKNRDIQSEFNPYIQLARPLYLTGPSHDFSHIERVFQLALQIGRNEGADLRIIGIAALFHDIGRKCEEESGGAICHAAASAAMTGGILAQRHEEPSQVAAICECIATHRFRDNNPPQSIEAKCLYDADKLDSLGAIGIARAYLWLGEHGGAVYSKDSLWQKVDPDSNRPEDDSLQREWHIKLRFIQERLFTETAKKIAQKRSLIMKNFLTTLEHEINGEE